MTEPPLILQEGTKKQVLQELIKPEDNISLTTKDLELLIPAAQANSPAAINRLCSGFKLLILSLAAEDNTFLHLREDAVNICWQEFLILVHNYKSSDYSGFPALVKTVLKRRLNDQLKRNINCAERQSSYEHQTENGLEVMDDKDFIEAFIDNESFKYAISKLNDKEQLLLYRTIYLEIPFREQALLQNQHVVTIRRQYHRTIEKLKAILGNNNKNKL